MADDPDELDACVGALEAACDSGRYEEMASAIEIAIASVRSELADTVSNARNETADRAKFEWRLVRQIDDLTKRNNALIETQLAPLPSPPLGMQ